MLKFLLALVALTLASCNPAFAQSGPKYGKNGGVGSSTSIYVSGEPSGGTYAINGTTGRAVFAGVALQGPIDQTRMLTGSYGFKTWNTWSIASDDADCVFCVDNYRLHYFGGAAARGSRVGDFSQLVQTAATGGTGVNFFTGSQGVIQTNTGDGGTLGNYRGGYYGTNPIAKCEGAYIYACSPGEADTMVKAGTTSKYQFGWAVANYAAAQGTVQDVGLIFYSGGEQSANLGGGPWGPGLGWKTGICFCELESNGFPPLSPSATVFKVDTTSLTSIPVTNGFDLRKLDISGFAWASTNFTLQGTGQIYGNIASPGFVNNSYHAGYQFLVNGATPGAWYAAEFAGNNATEALTAGIVVPVSATNLQTNAVGCWITSERAQPMGIGGDVCGFFRATAKASNSAVFPINTVANDTSGFTGQTLTNELDFNVTVPGTTVNGANFVIVSTTGATLTGDRNALLVQGAFHPTSTWSNGLVTANGAVDLYAAFIGSQTAVAGTNRDSQPIGFTSYTSGNTRYIATVRSDSTGGLVLRPGSSGGSVVMQSNAGANLFYVNQALAVSNVPIQLAGAAVASLPTCNAGLKGALMHATDLIAVTYNAPAAGGGALDAPVFCNGTIWTVH